MGAISLTTPESMGGDSVVLCCVVDSVACAHVPQFPQLELAVCCMFGIGQQSRHVISSHRCVVVDGSVWPWSGHPVLLHD